MSGRGYTGVAGPSAGSGTPEVVSPQPTVFPGDVFPACPARPVSGSSPSLRDRPLHAGWNVASVVFPGADCELTFLGFAAPLAPLLFPAPDPFFFHRLDLPCRRLPACSTFPAIPAALPRVFLAVSFGPVVRVPPSARTLVATEKRAEPLALVLGRDVRPRFVENLQLPRGAAPLASSSITAHPVRNPSTRSRSRDPACRRSSPGGGGPQCPRGTGSSGSRG